MSHYEERLERDLETIRDRVLAVAAQVEEAVRLAVHAFLAGDRPLAARTILGDLEINRKIRRIDGLCHAFVARHLPSAGHLRFVSAVLRIDIGLERIGDYAVTMCREVAQLTQPPPEAIARDVELMATQARSMLNHAMEAFAASNPDLARGTMGMADQSDALTRKLWTDLLREGERGSRPIRDLFALLIILNRLERVSDQAKNICEETVFAATGETKQPKVYSVLFLDRHNDRSSLLAEAWARKNYPRSGRFRSAGWSPAQRPAPEVLEFLAQHGLDFEDTRPAAIAELKEELAEFDVVVSLEGDPRSYLGEVPFHTAVLEWNIAPADEPLSLEEAYRRLTAEIRSLMETLRGEEAD